MISFFYLIQKMEGYILIGDEGNGRGHLWDSQRSLTIKLPSKNQKLSQKTKILYGMLKRHYELQKVLALWSSAFDSTAVNGRPLLELRSTAATVDRCMATVDR